jgi:hypothetical protein
MLNGTFVLPQLVISGGRHFSEDFLCYYIGIFCFEAFLVEMQVAVYSIGD